ncbi:hypothetical protein ACET3Z_002203 [Daucus carota]
MEDTVSQIVSDLETHLLNSPDSSTPISESTLLELQTLLDYTLRSKDPVDIEQFFDELSEKKVALSCLMDPIVAAMESGPTHLAILAAKVYLSLLLSPNAPVLTLFTPLGFYAVMRSIRKFFRSSGPSTGKSSGQDPGQSSGRGLTRNKRGTRGGGRGKGSKLRVEIVEEEEGGGDGAEGSEGRKLDVRMLFCVLDRLEMVLGLIHLDRFPECLKALVQTVAEVPVMGLENYGNSSSYDRLCGLCTQILCELLKADHGDQKNSATEVLKALVPAVLLLKSQVHGFGMHFVIDKMMGMAKDSDEIKKAVVYFPRYLVYQAPEKSEPRAAAVDSIVQIVGAMEYIDQVEFADHVIKMADGKHHLRLLAVDLISVMMTLLRDPFGIDAENMVENSWGMRCLEVLIRRCMDTTVGIRARALTNLARLVELFSKNESSRAILKKILAFDNKEHFRQVGPVNELLKQRCSDQKAAVRKAALLLTSKLTGLVDGAFDGGVLKTMGRACSDPLVSIRKAAMSALSEVFRTLWEDNVTKEWLQSIPCLISDNESSIQEECENLFLELVLDRVSRAGATSSPRRCNFYDSDGRNKIIEREEELFPEGVLCLLREIYNGEVTPWVKKLCENLGKKKRLKPKVAIALQNIINTSESLWLSRSMPIEKWTAPAGTWFLLSEVSAFLSKSVDWAFLHHHWKLLDRHEEGGEFKCSLEQEELDGTFGLESNTVAWAGDRVFLLKTISNVSVELPPENASELALNLLKRVREFNMHLTEVNAHLHALRNLCKQKAGSPEEADSLVRKWVVELLSNASEILETYMSNDLEANYDTTLLTPPTQSSESRRAGTTLSKLSSQAISAVYTIGSIVVIFPSVELKTVIPALHKIITSGRSGPRLSGSTKDPAPRLYFQAWLAMGKICLADEKLAKRYIPLFVEELEKSDSAAIRNCIVAVLTDFCVRYTALVDSYISNITKCLRDPCEVVRRQTFILLTRLLQRDYVKCRGVIFLRFLLTLVDESEKIRQRADFLFGNILKAKTPLLPYNSFVEAIYVLNDCNVHSGHSISQRDPSRLNSISGDDEKSRSQRMHIYTSLLKQMAPEHLLATFAKVCAEILAAASDGTLKVENAAELSVLQDAFTILSCKEIKLPSNHGTSSDSAEMDEDGGDSGGATASAGKGKLVTQAVKKNLIQNCIPIFVELKRILQRKNSPLIGPLMECLRTLLKDYKSEIDDLFVSDQQLQREVMYDMQKYEAGRAKSNATADVATMQKSEAFRSPGDPKTVNGSAIRKKLNETQATITKAASEVGHAVAEVTSRSVLKEVSKAILTPPIGSLSAPKVKASVKKSAIIASVRKKHTFDSDEDI